MNLLKSLIAAIKATTGSPGKKAEPIKTKLFVPIPEWNALVIQKLALEKKLKAAADALRQIECMTANDLTLDRVDTRVINRIALNAWRKTQE